MQSREIVLLESTDGWTKRAAAFGQVAFDASIAVGRLGVAAGKELAKDAAVARNTLVEKLGKTGANRRLIQLLGHTGETLSDQFSVKGRWDRRQGIWHSPKSLAKTFTAVQTQLEQIDAPEKLTIRTDLIKWTMVVECSWIEDLPKFKNSEHSVRLDLSFAACPYGARVDYNWVVDDFPKGILATRLVRIMNDKLEGSVEDAG